MRYYDSKRERRRCYAEPHCCCPPLAVGAGDASGVGVAGGVGVGRGSIRSGPDASVGCGVGVGVGVACADTQGLRVASYTTQFAFLE